MLTDFFYVTILLIYYPVVTYLTMVFPIFIYEVNNMHNAEIVRQYFIGSFLDCPNHMVFIIKVHIPKRIRTGSQTGACV